MSTAFIRNASMKEIAKPECPEKKVDICVSVTNVHGCERQRHRKKDEGSLSSS